MMPAARADDPPCPSQITPGAPAPAAPAQQGGPNKAPAAAKLPDSGKFDVTADALDGNLAEGKATVSGNVVVKRGDRVMRSNQATVDKNAGTVQSDGHIDYTDSLV